jgi:hypothetical protein
VLTSSRYPRWHPVALIARLVTTLAFSRFLLRLDTALPVREFTVGYHVSATKPSA